MIVATLAMDLQFNKQQSGSLVNRAHCHGIAGQIAAGTKASQALAPILVAKSDFRKIR